MRVLFNEVRNLPTAVSGEKCRGFRGREFFERSSTVAAAHVAAAEAELKAAHRPGVWAKYAQTPGGSSTWKDFKTFCFFPANHTQCGIF